MLLRRRRRHRRRWPERTAGQELGAHGPTQAACVGLFHAAIHCIETHPVRIFGLTGSRRGAMLAFDTFQLSNKI